MERSNNNYCECKQSSGWHAQSLRWAWQRRHPRHHALRGLRACHPSAREGKITLVTIFAILGMVVLAGFIGNAGHVVTKKMETQNAADAVAFSSAQWMARGMNAATATNHLIGEVTGLVVILESLGGPEGDVSIEAYPMQSKLVDQLNKSVMKTAPIRGLPAYLVTPPVTNADRQFIEKLVNLTTSSEKKKHKAFATIYDAKMTLKRDLTKQLVYKSAANVLLFVPPPWGYLTAAGGWAIHIDCEIDMIKIGKEWLILTGMELILPKISELLKVKVLERQLIPALAAHGDFLAGRPRNSSDFAAAKTGFVNGALGDTLRHLEETYAVKMAVYPKPGGFRLPISPEPGPSLKGNGRNGVSNKEWGSDSASAIEMNPLLLLKNQSGDAEGKIKYRIFELTQEVQKLSRLEDDVESQLKDEKLSDDQRRRLKDEHDAIIQERKDKQAKIKKLEKELEELQKERREMMKTLSKLSELPKTTGNLSINHIPLGKKNDKDKMNLAEERYTQWVRATYPFVDTYRAPILELFDRHLKRSEASKHYEKWTNRYTLVKAWQFRSGFRFEKGPKKNGMDSGVWRKKPDNYPLTMYLMAEEFNEKLTPAQLGKPRKRVQKGHEDWTKSSEDGKREAEKMFTVVGLAHRKLEPLFSPVVYPLANDDGITTFAQAIFYNANEQSPPPKKQNSSAKPETRQAKIGWDTLNWHPDSNAPEWGVKASKTNGAAKWPWDLFKSSDTGPNGTPQIKSAMVKLNWQAKLIPVTHTRLAEASLPGIAPGEMRANLRKTLLLFDGMVSH